MVQDKKKASVASSLGSNAESSAAWKISREELQNRFRMRATYEGRAHQLMKAQNILYSYGVKSGLDYPQNYHKTCKCQREIYSTEGVDVKKTVAQGNAFFEGVVQCASAWTCPICNPKIMERRRQDIKEVLSHTYKEGLGKKAVMVTLTFSHSRFQSLEHLIKAQAKAFTYLRSHRQYRKMKENIGMVGFVRALELTIKERNGWHPHTHELWIVDENTNVKGLKKTILPIWKKACEREGLIGKIQKKIRAFEERSIDIRDKVHSSDYLAKIKGLEFAWGADNELAKATVKGKGDGLHAFDLLNDSNPEFDEHTSKKLFHEYAMTMKGKHILFFSQGLKDWAGITDKTDKEVVEEKGEDSIHIVRLTKEQWSWIVIKQMQAELRFRVETDTAYNVVEWLKTIIPK